MKISWDGPQLFSAQKSREKEIKRLGKSRLDGGDVGRRQRVAGTTRPKMRSANSSGCFHIDRPETLETPKHTHSSLRRSQNFR